MVQYFLLPVIVLVIAIVMVTVYTTNKKVKEFKELVPNFISYCKSNKMELFSESGSSITYKRPLNYDKLKKGYFLEFDKVLTLPTNVILYHYIGMSYSGELNSIPNLNIEPNFANTFKLTNTISNSADSLRGSTSKSWVVEDSEAAYNKQVEWGYRNLARELEIAMNEAKTNGTGWFLDILKDEEIYKWREMALSSKVSSEFKEIIGDLLIPNRISFNKFNAHKDGMIPPDAYKLFRDDPLFSHSLYEIQQNPILRDKGYPDWFYYAFPDVIIWANSSAGKAKLDESTYSEYSRNTNNVTNLKYLKEIVSQYSRKIFMSKFEVSVDHIPFRKREGF